MKKIFISTLLAISLTPAFAVTSMKATVNGMVCAFCAQGIEKRISKMPATKAVYVDLKKKTVVVEPKDGMTLDQKAIMEEVKDAGYDIVKVESVAKSVAEIKAELAADK
ncbi:CopZ Copper chaperone [Oxalobacteraceae bacterium]|jgi:mercuric ion binding protein